MNKIKIFVSIALLSTLLACSSSTQSNLNDKLVQTPKLEPTNEVITKSEIEWGHLNPARGDKSPRAATLWGDRNGTEATGFLVEFLDGFSSPPHIHNVTYRGVVISGLVHNDDPNAEKMWMPAGSFWTQPAGEGHITAAKGENNMAYIEIDEGPYLVKPTEEAFDNGERPVNVDKSNIVWLDGSNLTWIDKSKTSSNSAKVAYLWGEPQSNKLNGTLLKLPAGFNGEILSKGEVFRAVVIQGSLKYQMPNESDIKVLESGSYFGSEGKSVHQVSIEANGECMVYIRSEGQYDIVSE